MRKPPQWQGVTSFTRGLFFFLAGMLAFFIKSYAGPQAAKILSGIGSALFLLGFILTSHGIAKQGQETAATEDDHDD